MMNRPAEVHLHIEELVLYGYSARERGALARDFETRLQDLLVRRPLQWRGPREVDRVGPIAIEMGGIPTGLGSSLADSLFDALRDVASQGGGSGG